MNTKQYIQFFNSKHILKFDFIYFQDLFVFRHESNTLHCNVLSILNSINFAWSNFTHQAGSIFSIKWILHLNGQWDPGTGYCGSPWECVAKSDKSNFLRKSIFCVLGAPKNFFEPPKPYLASETSLLGGVILLKLYDPIHGFGDFHGWLCQNIAILPSVALKP